MATVIDPSFDFDRNRNRGNKKEEMEIPTMAKQGGCFILLLAMAGIFIGSLAYQKADDNNNNNVKIMTLGAGPDGDQFTEVSVDQLDANLPISIPEGAYVGNEFEMSVNNGGGWLGATVGETKLGFRQRRVDPNTGKFTVPRSIRYGSSSFFFLSLFYPFFSQPPLEGRYDNLSRPASGPRSNEPFRAEDVYDGEC